jgi:hypothetical protein
VEIALTKCLGLLWGRPIEISNISPSHIEVDTVRLDRQLSVANLAMVWSCAHSSQVFPMATMSGAKAKHIFGYEPIFIKFVRYFRN